MSSKRRQALSREAVVKALDMRRELPNRPFHRIGDVARWVGVETHVIRYWEQEFALWFAQRRSSKNQRVFSTSEALRFASIRDWLYVELYTLEGAKRQLRLAAERERRTG